MLAVLVALTLAAEGPSVTVVSAGAPQLAVKAAQTTELPVVLVTAVVPPPGPTSLPMPTERISKARSAWVSADFATCLKLLEDDGAVTTALEQEQRTTAARMLTWRVACKLSARQADGARRDAEWLASLQLPLPDDVGVMTPDVETLLTSVRRAVDAQPRAQLSVTSPVSAASVAIDGRPGACTVPCRMALAAGIHVVQVSGDGYSPMARTVSLPAAGLEVNVALTSADPMLASTQWHRRHATGESFDGGKSMQLLSVALRSARLLMVEPSEDPSLVRGALAIDGVVQARGERDDVQALVRDLLVRGKVFEPSVPLWKRWPFWLAIGAAVVASGVTTGVLLANRPVSTRVVLNP
ncbi:MAG: PEGA domain-containing protein [Myxococcales bacterium]|nr:PEGA domain-containing protein [Myxococcales bacterium]